MRQNNAINIDSSKEKYTENSTITWLSIFITGQLVSVL